MDFVIIGTAGHIDHGKTALVKALTGTDTDRFKEEKQRGISIDIGFAPLVLSDGRRLGIVDVPGHERFIRNMLAGAGGMDLIMLVIDAREGIMPQTREHLAIMELLQVKSGLIVVTKTDLVDDEWLEFLHQELRTELADSFLHDAPIVNVSSVTGQGIPELRQMLEKMIESLPGKSLQGAFRMPIDRAFTVPGIGTVVTGTIWRGQVHEGDALDLLPGGETVRVRSLQVHGETKDVAFAGQRAALALTGLRKTVERGMTLVQSGVSETTRLLDVHVTVLKDAPRSLGHRERVRVHLGTAEVLGRILLLHDFEIAPGNDAVGQIMLEANLVAEPRDHFVLRTYSPMVTIAGGTVIDPLPPRLYRRNNASIEAQLQKKEQGSLADRILSILEQKVSIGIGDLALLSGETKEAVVETLVELEQTGSLLRVPGQDLWVPSVTMQSWETRLIAAINEYYRKNPYDLWVPKAVLGTELKVVGADVKWLDILLERIQRDKNLVIEVERLRFLDREIKLTGEEQRVYDRVWKAMSEQPLTPPGVAELEKLFDFRGKEKVLKNVLHVLLQQELILALNPEVYMLKETLEDAAAVAITLFQHQGAFSVADFRDSLGTSRKFALAILEYFDRQKWTRRIGDVREWQKKPQ